MSVSLDKVLETYLPKKVYDDIRPVLYGKQGEYLTIPEKALEIAKA